MMKTSDSITKIAAALAKAMPAIQNATKDAKNPHYKSSYASLAAVLDATKPVLAEHDIVVIQAAGWDGNCTLTTRLLHVSGEWIEATAGSPVAKMDPQGVGSAITYLRRYQLAAMCGITQEDDDGNVASQRRNPDTGQPNIPAAQWDALRLTLERKAVDGKAGEKEVTNALNVIATKDAARFQALKVWVDGL